jgi:hypothetical protein
MVRAAYSSGKPALGVGAGNVPAVIDESADIIACMPAPDNPLLPFILPDECSEAPNISF